jgi:hypothetical protein
VHPAYTSPPQSRAPPPQVLMTKKRLELNDISRSTEDPNPGRTLPSLSASTAEPPHKTASPRKPEALATALEAMSQAWAVEKQRRGSQSQGWRAGLNGWKTRAQRSRRSLLRQSTSGERRADGTQWTSTAPQ